MSDRIEQQRGQIAAALRCSPETTYDRAALHKRLDLNVDRIERYEREHPARTIATYTLTGKGLRRTS